MFLITYKTTRNREQYQRIIIYTKTKFKTNILILKDYIL